MEQILSFKSSPNEKGLIVYILFGKRFNATIYPTHMRNVRNGRYAYASFRCMAIVSAVKEP